MRVSPSLQPIVEKLAAIALELGQDVEQDDAQAKGRMYKRCGRRVFGVRVRSGHVSVHLHGLPKNEPDPTGLVVSRTQNHLRAELRTYDEARRLEPLLRRAYEEAG